jgi:hypothetical protein
VTATLAPTVIEKAVAPASFSKICGSALTRRSSHWLDLGTPPRECLNCSAAESGRTRSSGGRPRPRVVAVGSAGMFPHHESSRGARASLPV